MLIVTSRKGGVGKTSIAVNLAACLAAGGRRILLLDLDAQGDSSAWLGVDDTGEALAQALVGRGSLRAAIRATDAGVDLAPGGEALDLVDDRITADSVSDALAEFRTGYDQVIVDCPPALTRAVLSAYSTVGRVRALVPVDGPKALRAVARLQHAWKDAGLDPRQVSLVLTRHDRRRVLDRAIAKQTEALYGVALLGTRIRESVVVGESAAWRRPLILHAPRHPVTEDLRRLAREVDNG